eukprot:sb/3475885/
MNTNTNTEPTGKAGYGQTVTFTCPTDYYLGSSNGDMFTSTSSDDIRCKWADSSVQDDVVFSETTVPTASLCYDISWANLVGLSRPVSSNITLSAAGIKTISSVPDGDGTFEITITMPDDRDK